MRRFLSLSLVSVVLFPISAVTAQCSAFFSSTNANPNIVITNSGKTITNPSTSANNAWAAAMASGVPTTTSGILSFEVYVDSVSNVFAHVGFADVTQWNPSTWLGSSTVNNVKNGFSYMANGRCYSAAGTLVTTCPTYTTGDTIKVTYDLSTGGSQYYKNGVLVYTFTLTQGQLWPTNVRPAYAAFGPSEGVTVTGYSSTADSACDLPGAQGGAQGDPQFAGFQGQEFQIHGFADSYFNLLSSSELNINSRFAFLGMGSCTYNNTQCWTHPGTYLDHIGMVAYTPEQSIHLELVAGSHQQGMMAKIDNHTMSIGHTYSIPCDRTSSKNCITTKLISYDEFVISTSTYTFHIVNSDHFFNIQSTLKNHHMLTLGATVTDLRKYNNDEQAQQVLDKIYGNQFCSHGLIGQTWRNIRYADQKLYAGVIDDYVVNGLYDTQFAYACN